MRTATVVLVALVSARPSWEAQPRRASLELWALSPLVVRGSGFGAGEQVLLSATTPRTERAVSVVARRNGSFRALFRHQVRRCELLAVRAVGARGSRAILQLLPECRDERRKRERVSPP